MDSLGSAPLSCSSGPAEEPGRVQEQQLWGTGFGGSKLPRAKAPFLRGRWGTCRDSPTRLLSMESPRAEEAASRLELSPTLERTFSSPSFTANIRSSLIPFWQCWQVQSK